MASALHPDRRFARITDIDIQQDLLVYGLTCVFLDIDNTIRSRETGEIPTDVMEWMRAAQEAGVRLCLLSNNCHQNVYDLAAELDLPLVAKAMKPLPFGYSAALRQMGMSAGSCVAIGDQISTDIWGAHLCGITAYLVDPLSTVDLKHTVLVRKLEAPFTSPRR